MQAKLTKIYKTSNKKDGSPLIDRNGKPFTRLSIKVQEYGDKWLSGFSNPSNQTWREGDTVEIEVEQSGQYLNFKQPNPRTANLQQLQTIEKKLDEVLSILKGEGTLGAENLTQGQPEDDGPDVSDIPF
jgi:hypothetical protein